MAARTQAEITREVMAHRYLYYVLATPVLNDHEYDLIERKARELLPPDSVVHKVGSCLESSYTQEEIDFAYKLLEMYS